MFNLYEEIALAQRENKKAVLLIVISTMGSSPQKPGAKMLVFEDGSTKGTIGGGAVEKEMIEKAKQFIHTGGCQKFTFNLEGDLAMACGGDMDIYMETLLPVPRLYIFGAGHVGKALAMFAKNTGFSIHLIDPRENIFNERDTEQYTCYNTDYFKVIENIPFDQNSYIVIVTPKHQYDEELLSILAKKTYRYIGMIGSTRKVAIMKQRFMEENILTPDEIEKVDMPIGIKIAAQSPEEIAISIVAKLIDVKNKAI
ncbi:MAG TPA: XdhC family protein [Bacteroidales bacterium]|mgnify:FL=1|nr:XdhC family protein [Bacteroidales bacterium]